MSKPVENQTAPDPAPPMPKTALELSWYRRGILDAVMAEADEDGLKSANLAGDHEPVLGSTDGVNSTQPKP